MQRQSIATFCAVALALSALVKSTPVVRRDPYDRTRYVGPEAVPPFMSRPMWYNMPEDSMSKSMRFTVPVDDSDLPVVLLKRTPLGLPSLGAATTLLGAAPEALKIVGKAAKALT